MKNKHKIPIPKVGQKIYVPGELYLYRGEDDFAGGVATISKVKYNEKLETDNNNSVFVGIEGRPSTMYNWKFLYEKQGELKKQYKNQIAHANPDYREEFNQPDADWR